MRHKKGAAILLIAVLCLLALAYGAAFILKRHTLKAERDAYTVYASSYPVYAVGSMIINHVPGMQLKLLTQPQLAGYTAYTLSDWERALLSKADAVIFMGFGFEGFAADYTSDKAAIITLLSMLDLKSPPEGCLTLDYNSADEKQLSSASPWLYMSIDGMMELCEALCGNMAYLDQAYSSLYYDNLGSAMDRLAPLAQHIDTFDALAGKRIAVAHDALIYTACDLNADISLYIRRDTAQELTDEQIDECIVALKEAGTDLLLIEEQAEDTMIARFETAGITVIRQDIMLDLSAADGFTGYIDACNKNLKTINEALKAL